MALPPTTRRKRRRRRRTGNRKFKSRGRSRASRPRSDPADSTDEDYRIGDEEEEEEEDTSAHGPSSPSSSEEYIDSEEEDTPDRGHAHSRPRKRARRSCPQTQPAPRQPRPHRRNRRPHASSDEDFVIDEADDADNYSAEVVTRSASSRAAGSSSRNAREGVHHDAGSSSRRLIADLPVIDSVGRIDEGRGSHTGINDIAPKCKGKDKVIEDEETKNGDDSAPVCGVCLCQEDVVERGKLDCCDHFFCFGCIMEWAKVESRCPMCKQRFVTIVRAGNGKSKRTRTVRIPLRNQVYIPPEEDVPVADDPYADVVCMECHEIGEESLLLLCDHCDSAAHTYCVGLGRSVPHGDWFCRSCQALIAETFDSEDQEEELVLIASDKDEEYEDEESVLRAIVDSSEPRTQRRRQRAQGASTSASTSLSSAPRRHRTGVRGRILRRLSGQRRRPVSAPRLSQAARALMREAESINHGSSSMSEMQHPTQPSSARTVPGQRRLQERIQIMRNDWERIQTGALPFAAVGVHLVASTQGAVSADNRNPLLRTSRSTEESAASKPNNRTSNLVSAGNGPACSKEQAISDNSEIEQAWRMMDHAKNLTSSEHVSVSSSTSRARLAPQYTAANGILSSTMKRPETIHSALDEQSKRLAHIDRAVTNDTQSQHASLVSSSPTKDQDGNADELRGATIASAENETAICMQSSGSGDSTDQPALIGGVTGQVRARELSVISASNPLQSSVNSCGTVNGIINGLNHESKQVSTYGVSQKCLYQIPASNICHRSNGETPGEDVISVAGEGRDGRFSSLEREGISGSSSLVNSYGTSNGIINRLDRRGKQASAHGVSQKCLDQIPASNICHRSHEERPGEDVISVAGRGRDGRFSSLEGEGIAGSSIPTRYKEDLKGHIAHVVKKHIWPFYLSEGLGKEQFKHIAKSAVHMLLDLCKAHNENPVSSALTCAHVELQATSVIVGCCNGCFNLQVEKAVRAAKAKVRTS